MANKAYISIRRKLRKSLRDELVTRWTDDALDKLIDEAQREYCASSHSLSGKVRICNVVISDDDALPILHGVVELPEDFIRPVKVVDKRGFNIPIASWRSLGSHDFRSRVGKVREAIFDFDGWGRMRLVPMPEDEGEVATLFYERFPKEGVLEVENEDAIVEYALYIATMYVEGDAREHFGNFSKGMLANRQGTRDLNQRRRRGRGGDFF